MCTSCRCSGNSAFSWDIYLDTGFFFFGFPHATSWRCSGFSWDIYPHTRIVCFRFLYSLWGLFFGVVQSLHHADDPVFLGTFTWTPVLFSFRFSTQPWDLCFIFACVQHIYLGHWPMKLFVYIMQMLQIFLGHLAGHWGCFFWVFHTFPGHVLHIYMSMAYLCGTFLEHLCDVDK